MSDLSHIPTPETTGARRRLDFPGYPRYIVDVEVSEDLERRLAVAREALANIKVKASVIQGLMYGYDGDCGAVTLAGMIEELSDDTLTLTAPK